MDNLGGRFLLSKPDLALWEPDAIRSDKVRAY